jgi:hypothetical protein
MVCSVDIRGAWKPDNDLLRREASVAGRPAVRLESQ